jgi:hypothetical protein
MGTVIRPDLASTNLNLGVSYNPSAITIRGVNNASSNGDYNGYVGIGTTAPAYNLIVQNNRTDDNPLANATVYVKSAGRNASVELDVPTTTFSTGIVARLAGTERGRLTYVHNGNYWAMTTNGSGTNKMSLTSDGRLTAGPGQATIYGHTFGGGFPADTYYNTGNGQVGIHHFFSNVGGVQNLKAFIRADGTFITDAGNGNTFSQTSGAVAGGGADYAEYFEWADGNPSAENRKAESVVLVGNKIRVATDADAPSSIIGVVSMTPLVVGDAAPIAWKGKYLRDSFGLAVVEQVEHWRWMDDTEGSRSCYADQVPEGWVVPEDKEVELTYRPVLNPDYDSSEEYVPREHRKEWSPVGLVGKLRLKRGQPVGDRWIKLQDISESVEEWLVR